MNPTRKPSAILIALYLNAALLLAILMFMVGRDHSQMPAAFGDAMPASQLPIAGGNGIYVVPCQLHPSVWGCMVIDTQRQNLAVYEYQAGQKLLQLTAARHIGYDLQLKNLNTDPAFYEVEKQVKDQTNAENSAEGKPAGDTKPPEGTK